MIGLLKQLQPRAVVIFGCALLILAGMNGLLAWLGPIPPADKLFHVTGRLQELTLQNPSTGSFKITLVTKNALRTFDLENAHRLVALRSRTATLEGEGVGPGMPVALDYFAFGRGEKVVDVTLGKTKVLSYDEVAKLAGEKATNDRISAVRFGIAGAFLVFLGGFARIASNGSRDTAASNPDTTIGVLIWLTFYGILLVVLLTEPTILHRASGTNAFHLPIEYVLAPAIAVVLLPLWPGCTGLGSLVRQAMQKGRTGKLGMVREMALALASNNPAERRMGFKALWFFAYLGLLFAGWIVYAP